MIELGKDEKDSEGRITNIKDDLYLVRQKDGELIKLSIESRKHGVSPYIMLEENDILKSLLEMKHSPQGIAISEMFKNIKLEIEMGPQGLPVGIEEISRLIEIINETEPEDNYFTQSKN